MKFKLIVNADDFGPIDFINQGVFHHLSQGNLDSAQILVNMPEDKLKENLKKLHSYVPADRVFDVGVHFTLTSGAPITGGDDKAGHWGKMVDTIDGVVYFKDFTKFHFGYADYFQEIEDEFLMQRDRLIKLIDEVNSEAGTKKLEVTCVSNHHNIFTIAPDLFELYVKMAETASIPLKIRSPKASPYKTIKPYFGVVMAMKNTSITIKQKNLMTDMCFNISNNNYTADRAITIKSPAYIDIDFYKNLGSLSVEKVKKRKTNNRVEKFREMMERAESYIPNTSIEPDAPAVIEFVFHLGASDNVTKGSTFKEMASIYPGITHKYFDNRQTEVLALNELSKEFKDYIKTKVSWHECGEITYRQMK